MKYLPSLRKKSNKTSGKGFIGLNAQKDPKLSGQFSIKSKGYRLGKNGNFLRKFLSLIPYKIVSLLR